MTVEANKALFQRYFDALTAADPIAIDEVLTEDFIAYDLPEGQQDREGLKRFRERVKQMLPDQVGTVDYLISEGDLVAAHLSGSQTVDGESITISLIEFLQVRDGKFAWRRAMVDEVTRQLRQRLAERSRQLQPQP